MMLTKDDKKAYKVKKIKSAAKKLFMKNGYYDTAVSDIANQAGLAKGTVYLYFKSKEDLYFSVLSDYLRKLKKQIESIGKKSSSSLEAIKTMINHYKKEHSGHQDFLYTSSELLAKNPELLANKYVIELRTIERELFSYIDASFESFVETNSPSYKGKIQARSLLWGLMAYVHGVSMFESKKFSMLIEDVEEVNYDKLFNTILEVAFQLQ